LLPRFFQFFRWYVAISLQFAGLDGHAAAAAAATGASVAPTVSEEEARAYYVDAALPRASEGI